MKRFGFTEQLSLALILAALSFPLSLFFMLASPLRAQVLTWGAIEAIYLIWVITRRDTRAGNILCGAALIACTALTIGASPPMFVMLMAFGALGWTARMYLYHRTPLSAVGDGILSMSAALITAWTAARLGILPLTVWTFFLCQAASAFIPSWNQRSAGVARKAPDPFYHSAEAAEAAIAALLRKETTS